MTAIPGPLQSLVFRNADLPALFHHTDAIAIARQREAVNTTRWQLILLVVGAIPAALPWHWEVADTFQLTRLRRRVGLPGCPDHDLPLVPAQSKVALATKPLRGRVHQVDVLALLGARFSVRHRHPAPRSSVRKSARRGTAGAPEGGLAGPPRAYDGFGGGLITDSMRELRDKAFTVRKETYVRDRLIEQRSWYRRRQEVSRRATLVWSTTIAALTAFALVLALLQDVLRRTVLRR